MRKASLPAFDSTSPFRQLWRILRWQGCLCCGSDGTGAEPHTFSTVAMGFSTQISYSMVAAGWSKRRARSQVKSHAFGSFGALYDTWMYQNGSETCASISLQSSKVSDACSFLGMYIRHASGPDSHSQRISLLHEANRLGSLAFSPPDAIPNQFAMDILS